MDLSYSNPRLRRLFYRFPVFIQEWIAALYALKVHRRRFGGVFQAQLNELNHNQYLNSSEKEAIQLSLLKSMLIYSGENVPYYRKLFSEIKFDPSNIKSVDDIRIIPPLEKETIRSHQDQLLAEFYQGPIIKGHTSGTSGTALNFILSEEANQRHYACLWFHFGWANVHRGDPVATFGGHPIVGIEGSKPPFWLYDRLGNDLMFSAYHIKPDTIPFYVQSLNDFNPTMIRGYPSQIYLIALHFLETGHCNIHPNAIYTYAETLLDRQRQVIEQAFDCPVYSSYGNGEHTGHLLQCKEGNFHVVHETCVIELLREDGEAANAGEVGELVITSLINKAMPMIRYKIGDTGILSEGACKCGRSSPIFTNLTGRVEDFIVTPDGRHLGRLDHIFLKTLNVKEAQIVQEKIDSIVIRVVPRLGFDLSEEKLIMKEIHLRIGDMMNVRLELVNEIPRTAQGKFRFVVSKVPVQFTIPE
jgi:phenylacetate-CoA ligase